MAHKVDRLVSLYKLQKIVETLMKQSNKSNKMVVSTKNYEIIIKKNN